MEDKKSKIIILNFALSFCILIFAFCIFAAKAANAATLYFSPSSGEYAVGKTLSANVYISSADQAMNAASGVISFPQDKLEVTSLSKSGSIFSLWVQEPSFSNAAGTVNFEGIVLNPGFTGATGKVITINFRTKVVGSALVNFSSGSALANDGKGTNILASLGNAQFNLGGAASTAPTILEKTIPSTVSGASSAPQISSSTHLDQNKWYSNNNPVFKWNLPASVTEVKLVLSKRAGTLPQISYIPPISEKYLTDVDDGVWFLNARFRTNQELGPIASFRFKIDTQQPKDFTISRLDNNDAANPYPMLMFESSDNLSGIDRYEMKIGQGGWFKIEPSLAGKPYKLPRQAPGTKGISLKAFDRAGNAITSIFSVSISSIEPPTIESLVPSQIKSDTPLIITGLATPEQKVLVFISSTNVIELETIADSEGRWFVKYEQPLPKGKHQVHARVINKREAVSDPSNYVAFEIVSGSMFDRIMELLFRGFDNLINFSSNGWLSVILGAFGAILIYWLAKKIIPFLTREVRKVSYIAGEYKLDKGLRQHHRKVQLEVKILYDDLQKELALFKKIEQHRGLHPEEKYFKEKLEKYLQLIKSFRRLG